MLFCHVWQWDLGNVSHFLLLLIDIECCTVLECSFFNIFYAIVYQTEYYPGADFSSTRFYITRCTLISVGMLLYFYSCSATSIHQQIKEKNA